MVDKTTVVVPPTEVVSDSPVINPNDIQDVPDDAAKNMPDGYKNDFFKQKDIAKAAKERADKAEAQVKQFEEQENERLGNHQKIIETLKEENTNLNDRLTKNDLKEKHDKFNSVMQNKAKALGFTKPAMIMNFFSVENKALLAMDEDMNVDDFGLNKAFENVKIEWPELFKPKAVIIADGNPTTNITQVKIKKANDMTSAERIAMVKLKTQ